MFVPVDYYEIIIKLRPSKAHAKSMVNHWTRRFSSALKDFEYVQNQLEVDVLEVTFAKDESEMCDLQLNAWKRIYNESE